MPIAPTMRNAVQRTLRIGAFAPSAERPRQSVTQQFFLDGERQEAEGWKDMPLVPEASALDPDIDFDSFDQIPRMPRQHLFLKLAAVGVVAIGVAAGVLWSGGDAVLGGHVKAQFTRATGAVRAAFASPESAMATEVPSPGGPAAVAASSPVDTHAMATHAVETTAPATEVSGGAQAVVDVHADVHANDGEGRLGGNIASAGLLEPKDAVRAGVAEVGSRSGAHAGAAQEARSGQSDRRRLRQQAQSVDDPVPSHNAGDRPEALRGFVWSPSAKALVPVGSDLSTMAPDPTGNQPAAVEVRGVVPSGVTPAGEPGAVPAQP